MQSIFAIAGVVGFAAAAVAPVYGAASQQEAATAPAYVVSSQQEAATVPAYVASSTEEAALATVYPTSTQEVGQAPVYSNVAVKSESAVAPAPVYYTSYQMVTETISTSQYVTYCPKPTIPATLVYNTNTVIVTEATTLTITACANGCTITKTVPVVNSTEEAGKIVPTPYVPVQSQAAATIVKPVSSADAKPSPPAYQATESKPIPAVSTEEAATVYRSHPAAAVTAIAAYKSQNASTEVNPTAPAKYTGDATRVGAGAFALVAAIAALL